MTRSKALPALLLALVLPGAAFALPQVGDVLGTDPAVVRPALEAAGCTVDEFEVEEGLVEAKCREVASGKRWEIYIDPQTGVVRKLSADD
jgi:hypothetical protein